jgi:hypothetical protein
VRIGWILGWAAPEAWFAPLAREALPRAEHTFVLATPEALDVLPASGEFDWIVGYSLGTLLLLQGAARLAHPRVALLAPIFAFPREEGLGGRISRTQVVRLKRWLQHEPVAALADFYERAVLHVPSGLHPGTPENLLWGLERLERDRVAPPLPPGWKAWCGAKDTLLDAAALHALDPAVEIVPDAGHHPGKLIRRFAEDVA